VRSLLFEGSIGVCLSPFGATKHSEGHGGEALGQNAHQSGALKNGKRIGGCPQLGQLNPAPAWWTNRHGSSNGKNALRLPLQPA